MMGHQPCYCKGIIMVVLGVLFLLESLQVIKLGIMPYLPAVFIIMGICIMLPCCCSKKNCNCDCK